MLGCRFGGGLLRRCVGAVAVVGVVSAMVVVPSGRADAAGDKSSFDGVRLALPAMTGGDYRWVGGGPNPNPADGWVNSWDHCVGGFDFFLTKAGAELEHVKTSCYEDGLVDRDEDWHRSIEGRTSHAKETFGCVDKHFAPMNAIAVRAGDRIDAIAFGCVDYDKSLSAGENALAARTALEPQLDGGDGGRFNGMICKNPDHVIVQMRFYYNDDDILGLGDVRCALPFAGKEAS